MIEFRLYTFVNFYLSSIQQGIQSAHVLGDMSVKYRAPKYYDDVAYHAAHEDFWDWNENHKTLITLNGGANADIRDKYHRLNVIAPKLQRPAAFECFCEDVPSLDGIMTACGVIVSSTIYDSVPQKNLVFENANRFNPEINDAFYCVVDGVIEHVFMPESADAELARMIKSCSLAR